jgi:exodeoxyribonuclease VII large subunit
MADEMPSLAGLRRGRAKRPAAQGLFDALPEMAAPVAPETAAPSSEAAGGLARIFTVAELVGEVRLLVERRFARVTVEGEISNWRPAASGHCYFTLKDGEAQLSIVMFRRQAMLLRVKPKDGDAVRVTGSIGLYEARGQLQLIAERLEPVGLGALLAATQALKERLRGEGLFDRKRPLPAFPRRIGVVTSLQGAALRDIIKVCRRRHAGVQLLIYPAAVQGPRCGVEVAAGIRWFSAHSAVESPGQVDLVIVARGGGSWEDLHGFDEEGVARAIVACLVPVLTGIGHATDTTIADAAADVCAPTPSAAAELATAAQFGLAERLVRLRARLERAGRYELLRRRQELAKGSAEMMLRRVEEALRRREQRLDDLEGRAETALGRGLAARMGRWQRADARLQRRAPALRVAEDRRRADSLAMRLDGARLRAVAAGRTRLDRAGSRLEALSPLRVLERGYALVYGADGRLLRASSEVNEGEGVTARLAVGRLRATVTGKE